MQNKKFTSFNDGIVKICEQQNYNVSFKTTINPKTYDDLKIITRLFYKTQNIRQQDLEFVNEFGSSLNLKIKTRINKNINTSYKAIIDNNLYSIIQIDFDNINKEMYFYLEKERILNA